MVAEPLLRLDKSSARVNFFFVRGQGGKGVGLGDLEKVL